MRYKYHKALVLGGVFLTGMMLPNVVLADTPSTPAVEMSQFYKADTDGDGIIDMYDTEPDKWNISDRDLRFFMELSYRTSAEVLAIFDAKDENAINQFNINKLAGNADVRELINHWIFDGQINESDGFSVSFFRNGSQVVVAFRGTNDKADYDDDIALMMATQPGQVKNLTEVLNRMKQEGYTEYYLTGHSLGGYLAQYFAARDLMTNPQYIHSAVFNAPGISSSAFSGSEHQQTAKNKDELVKLRYDFNFDTRYPLSEYKAQAYSIHGDTVGSYNYYANTQWLNNISGKGTHSSTGFVAAQADSTYRKYFSVGYRLDKPFLTLDSDGDKILDVDELHIGTDISKVDSDGDGYWDYIELLMGSDPLSRTSYPSFNQLYTALPTKKLVVQHPSEVTEAALLASVFAGPRQELQNLTSQFPKHSNEEVTYQFLNLPKDWSKLPAFYDLQVQATYKDGSKSDVFPLRVIIHDNAKNKMADYEQLSIQNWTGYEGDKFDLLAQIGENTNVKSKEIVQAVSTDKAGEFIGKVKVTFTDGSSRVEEISVTVKKRETPNIPSLQAVVINKSLNEKSSMQAIFDSFVELNHLDKDQVRLSADEEKYRELLDGTKVGEGMSMPIVVEFLNESKDQVIQKVETKAIFNIRDIPDTGVQSKEHFSDIILLAGIPFTYVLWYIFRKRIRQRI